MTKEKQPAAAAIPIDAENPQILIHELLLLEGPLPLLHRSIDVR
jgi:hypothetical protein